MGNDLPPDTKIVTYPANLLLASLTIIQARSISRKIARRIGDPRRVTKIAAAIFAVPL
jgi:hypothetical protein